MRIKFNRGPNKNKVGDFPDGTTILRWAEAKPFNIRDFDRLDPYATIERREGTYMKSNVRLKNGTYVFEWMGWIDNGTA